MSDKLKELKDQADKLGISYSGKIGEDTLAERIKKEILALATEQEEEQAKVQVEETVAQRNSRIKAESSKLVRIRLANMNPANTKKAGIAVQGGNSLTGNVGKFVPFNAPWLVPQILVNILEEKEHLGFNTKTDARTGKERKTKQMIKSYAIEYLADLTREELKDLKAQQKAAGNVGED